MRLSIRGRLFIMFLVPLGFFVIREGMNAQKTISDYFLYKAQKKTF